MLIYFSDCVLLRLSLLRVVQRSLLLLLVDTIVFFQATFHFLTPTVPNPLFEIIFFLLFGAPVGAPEKI